MLLEKLLSASAEDVRRIVAGLRKTAHSVGLEFGDRTKTYNSRLAQELGLWAESKNLGHPFHMQVFKAYFVHGKNIAQTDVLLELVRAAGLPESEALEVIKKRKFKDEVDRDWAFARENNIVAAPTFIANKKRLVGAQSYEKLVELVSAEIQMKPSF